MLININTVHGWDIATALRGPDFPDPNVCIKALTTCQLRRCLGVTSGHPANGFTQLPQRDGLVPGIRDLGEFERRSALTIAGARELFTSNQATHFRTHLCNALLWAMKRNFNRKGYREARLLTIELKRLGFLPSDFPTS